MKATFDNMAKLVNDFHGTSLRIVPMHLTESDDGYSLELTYQQEKKAKRILCGDKRCSCSLFGVRGKQSYKGKKLTIRPRQQQYMRVQQEALASLTRSAVAIALYVDGEERFSKIAELIGIDRGTLWRAPDFQKFRDFVQAVRELKGDCRSNPAQHENSTR